MAHQLNLADGKRSAGLNHPKGPRGVNGPRQYVQATMTVDQPMNNHGGMRLSVISGNQVYQVVDYATEEIRESLAHTAQGVLIEVRLVRLGSRGDAWRVVADVSLE